MRKTIVIKVLSLKVKAFLRRDSLKRLNTLIICSQALKFKSLVPITMVLLLVSLDSHICTS